MANQESRLAIVIDSKQAEQNIKRLRTALKNVGKESIDAGAGLEVLSEVLSPLKQLDSLFGKAAKSAKDLSKSAKDTTKSVTDLAKESKANADTTKDLGDKAKVTGNEVDKLGDKSSKAKKGVKELGDKAGETGSRLERMKKSINGFNDGVSGLRNAALVGMGALTGVLYKSIGTAQKFETAMAEVNKTVDFESPQGLEDMRKGLEDLSTQIPQTFEELAATASNAGLLGVAEKDILGFTETVAKMGVAFDIQSDAVAESMAKIANVFKIPIKDIGELGDVINHLSNNMASTAGEIIDFTKRTASMADTAGLSENATAAFGSAMVALGMPAEVAGTAFNAFLGKLSNLDGLSKRGKAAFNSMGLDANKFATLMQTDAQAAILLFIETLRDLPKEMQAATAYDVLGAELAPKVLAMAAGYDEVTRAINMTADAAGSMEKEFAAISDTSANKMVLFKNNIDLVFAAVGDAFIPALNDALAAVKPFLESMADWAKKNPELVQGLTLAAAAVGGFILAASGIGLTVASFMALTNPVSLAVIAVGALVGVGVALADNWDTIKAKAAEVWESVKKSIDDNAIALSALAAVMGSVVIGLIAVHAQAIASTAAFAATKVAIAAYNAALSIANGIMAAWAGVKLVASLALIGARVVANTAIFIAHKTVLMATRAATLAWFAVLGVGKLVALGAVVVANTVKMAAQTAAITALKVATVAWSVASKAAAVGANLLGVAIRFMLGPIGVAITVIGALVSAGVYLYKNWDTVKAKATAIWNGVKETIINSLSGLPARLLQAGKDAVQGLINGLKSKMSAVTSAGSGLAKAAIGAIRGIAGFDSHSPSRKTTKAGEEAGQGLANGMKKKTKVVKTEAQKLAEQAISSIKDTISNLKRDIALFGNDDPIAAMLWDRANTDKYKGVGDGLFNQAVDLTKQKQTLDANDAVIKSIKDIERNLALIGRNDPLAGLNYDLVVLGEHANVSAENIDKLKERTLQLATATADNNIAQEITNIDRQLYELGSNRTPLEMLVWDIENAGKHANASAKAIEELKAKTKQWYEAQKQQKRIDDAQKALTGLGKDLQDEQSPMAKIIAERDQRLAIIKEANQLELLTEQQHKDALLAVDESYMNAKRDLLLTQSQDLFSGLSGLAKAFVGEQSGIYRALFAVEKGFAIAQAAIAIQQSIAKAMSVGFPQNIPFIGQAVAQGGQIMSAIKSVSMPVGQAHDGIMSVPKSGTWNLEKGERVLPQHTAKALDKKLDKDGSKVIINNYTNEKAEAKQTPDGDIIVTIGKMIDAKIEQRFIKSRRQGWSNYGR